MARIPVHTITLELTHQCHRRCSFCYLPNPEDRNIGKELDPEQLAFRVNGLIDETGCKNVQLSGGEPLLKRSLLPCIDILLEKGAKVSILTDGGALDETLCRELRKRSVGPIQPTLLSGTAQIHDSLRGEGSFKEITRGIALASSVGIPTIVSMVVTSKNWDQAQTIAEIAFALGARGMTLARFCPVGKGAKAYSELMPSPQHIDSAARQAAKVCRELQLELSAAITIPKCAFRDPERPPLKIGTCSLMGPSTTVTIGPDGSVRTCAMSHKKVGILGEIPWRELSERLWQQELGPCRESIPKICIDCGYRAGCLCGCRLSALATKGRLDGRDPLAPGLGNSEKGQSS